MLFLVVLALAALTVPLAGGDLRRLGQLDWRAGWALIAAFATQVLALSVIPGDTTAHRAAHVASYALAATFILANRAIPGVLIAGAGGALNALVIALNGGVLPASRTALETAGIDPAAAGFHNSAVLAEPHLLWLGDVLAVPDALPFANVFSAGDVLLLVGAAVLLHGATGSRLARPRAARA
jgi:Family of unknown function (DUF5317)